MKSVRKLFCILSICSVVVGMLVMAAYAGSKIVLVGFADEAEYSATCETIDNANDGNKHAGKGPIAFVELNTDPKNAQSGHSAKFISKPHGEATTWVSYQITNPGTWDLEKWNTDGSLYFTIKGDGSGEGFRVELFDLTLNMRFWSTVTIKLDHTGWKEYEFPIASFQTPEGESMLDYWDWLTLFAIRLNYAGAPVAGDREVVFYVDRIEVDAK
jgi:hypothetical protein